MGQYFKAVNLDKREVVCPWCLGGGAKLWEWAVNPQGAIFTLLLRKSSATGGGDYGGPEPQTVEVSEIGEGNLAELIAKSVVREGLQMPIPSSSVVGRWAGDRIALVGDYDESGLCNELDSYTNITEQLIVEWNRFVDFKDAELEYRPCSCVERSKALSDSPPVS